MDSFRIKIADLVTEVQPLFESTRDYCRKYLSDETPDYHICITEDDLIFEQKMLDIEAVEEGLKRRRFSGPFLERTAIQRKIAEKLLEYNTLLMHGSTVGLDGYAYLFTAHCGTGKSTHTRLWREVFGERAIMINDDKPFLQVRQGHVVAFGSPWSGKHGLDHNIALPLKGVCILSRGSVNRICATLPEDAAEMLRHQCMIPANPVLQAKALSLVDDLMNFVPLWKMECTKDPEAARISWSAMSANTET